jgi:hypothetical protein
VRFNLTRRGVRIACPCHREGLLESRVSCHHPDNIDAVVARITTAGICASFSCLVPALFPPKFITRSIWRIANPGKPRSVCLGSGTDASCVKTQYLCHTGFVGTRGRTNTQPKYSMLLRRLIRSVATLGHQHHPSDQQPANCVGLLTNQALGNRVFCVSSFC